MDNERLYKLVGSVWPRFAFRDSVRLVRFVDDLNISSGIGPLSPVASRWMLFSEGSESKPVDPSGPAGTLESPVISRVWRLARLMREVGRFAGTPGNTRDLIKERRNQYIKSENEIIPSTHIAVSLPALSHVRPFH